jgi:hypothetical protein
MRIFQTSPRTRLLLTHQHSSEFSVGFVSVSDKAVADIQHKLSDMTLRRRYITEAEKIFSSEAFRFLIAIYDWERITDRRTKTITAYKMIATYVESGGKYENNMTAHTRERLIDAKAAKRKLPSNFFEDVKLELISDILQNPDLKRIIVG